jgi:inner membrane protein
METIEKTSIGLFNSVGFKLALIGLLSLLLLIPASMILGLIREREQRRNETINEVTSIWGNAQTITGPVLTIPYQTIRKTSDKEVVTTTNYAHFLPENLRIEGEIIPEVRNRGIYKVVTYITRLHITGNFGVPDMKSLNIGHVNPEEQSGYLEIGIPDMRGINKDISINWDDSILSVIPGLKTNDISESGIHAIVGITNKKPVGFSFDLDLNGSHSLNFIPLGRETNVRLKSSWTSPSFQGAFLPDNKNINEKGFLANWNILQLNRNFPQQWINDQYTVTESSFGVELITPVDTYQKSERSAKYAILFIGLTFLVFFFAEVMTKTRIHAVNYLLTGFALCIFYSLLTALSEHIPFNAAYFISAATIITMIALFARSLYKKRGVTFTVVSSLIVLYIFLFVILQLIDYSLLFGNIGLVIILGIVMYFSRKIDWYSTVKSSKNQQTMAE